jgi:hypothetical protein
MTERAKIASAHRDKKRIFAPEIPKPKSHNKSEKVWYLQYRYTEEVWEKMMAEDKRREEEFGNKRWMPWVWTVGKNNDWVREGKYYEKEAAEVVMNQQLKHQKEHNWGWNHEYRIIHKDDLQKEKNEKKMLAV